jgi:hypothetical protein
MERLDDGYGAIFVPDLIAGGSFLLNLQGLGLYPGKHVIPDIKDLWITAAVY